MIEEIVRRYPEVQIVCNKKTLAIVVCAVLVVGVAIARYGFYATCSM